MNKLIILDRDGVINKESSDYIKSPDEWLPITSSIKAIAKLKENNFFISIVTNQSGLARGYFSIQTLHAIHDKLKNTMQESNANIDEIYFCPHHPNYGCECRKPKPKLLLKALKQFNASSTETFVVGDTIKDVRAAIAANCKPILVLTGYGEKTLHENKSELTNVDVYENLCSFVETICK